MALPTGRLPDDGAIGGLGPRRAAQFGICH